MCYTEARGFTDEEDEELGKDPKRDSMGALLFNHLFNHRFNYRDDIYCSDRFICSSRTY